MTKPKQIHMGKTLHELMEDDFQKLVDIIEQKQIIHEDIQLTETAEADPITQAAQQLQRQSQELGADTLAEYFHELEVNARNGALKETSELLHHIQDEFENVKDILADD
ncbi:MAG: hypothetical protein OQL16_11030 [Gammaproteobacteria bacterium]|nr:hypothetical protein [Gammaproteobacteria bacterium]